MSCRGWGGSAQGREPGCCRPAQSGCRSDFRDWCGPPWCAGETASARDHRQIAAKTSPSPIATRPIPSCSTRDQTSLGRSRCGFPHPGLKCRLKWGVGRSSRRRRCPGSSRCNPVYPAAPPAWRHSPANQDLPPCSAPWGWRERAIPLERPAPTPWANTGRRWHRPAPAPGGWCVRPAGGCLCSHPWWRTGPARAGAWARGCRILSPARCLGETGSTACRSRVPARLSGCRWDTTTRSGSRGGHRDLRAGGWTGPAGLFWSDRCRHQGCSPDRWPARCRLWQQAGSRGLQAKRTRFPSPWPSPEGGGDGLRQLCALLCAESRAVTGIWSMRTSSHGWASAPTDISYHSPCGVPGGEGATDGGEHERRDGVQGGGLEGQSPAEGAGVDHLNQHPGEAITHRQGQQRGEQSQSRPLPHQQPAAVAGAQAKALQGLQLAAPGQPQHHKGRADADEGDPQNEQLQ